MKGFTIYQQFAFSDSDGLLEPEEFKRATVVAARGLLHLRVDFKRAEMRLTEGGLPIRVWDQLDFNSEAELVQKVLAMAMMLNAGVMFTH